MMKKVPTNYVINTTMIIIFFCRYVRLLEVWEYFNKNEDCQCFICFLNKLPKSGDDKLDLDIIKEYFCYIKKIFQPRKKIKNQSKGSTLF